MYQEYAIDPTTICRSWERFRYVWDGLGYDEGRLLSAFPKSWFKELYESDTYKSLSPITSKRVEEKLRQEKFEKRRIIAANRTASSNTSDWLEFAIAGHAEKEFHAILAETNPRNKQEVAIFDDLDRTATPWEFSKPANVKRKGADLSRAAKLLLRKGRSIVFIDPHFCFETRFKNSFTCYLKEIAESGRLPDKLEIHMNYSASRGAWNYFVEEFVNKAAEKFGRCIPSGSDIEKVLEFFVWDDEQGLDMHPRYILTEIGGLSIEVGLDEKTHSEEFTDIYPLGYKAIQDRMDEYSPTSQSRRLRHQFRLCEAI